MMEQPEIMRLMTIAENTITAAIGLAAAFADQARGF